MVSPAGSIRSARAATATAAFAAPWARAVAAGAASLWRRITRTAAYAERPASRVRRRARTERACSTTRNRALHPRNAWLRPAPSVTPTKMATASVISGQRRRESVDKRVPLGSLRIIGTAWTIKTSFHRRAQSTRTPHSISAVQRFHSRSLRTLPTRETRALTPGTMTVTTYVPCRRLLPEDVRLERLAQTAANRVLARCTTEARAVQRSTLSCAATHVTRTRSAQHNQLAPTHKAANS
jgi:hypothetical protein